MHVILKVIPDVLHIGGVILTASKRVFIKEIPRDKYLLFIFIDICEVYLINTSRKGIIEYLSLFNNMIYRQTRQLINSCK